MRFNPYEWDEQVLLEETVPRRSEVEVTIGIDLGDVWSHYYTLNKEGGVVNRGRFRTTTKAIEKWLTEAGGIPRLDPEILRPISIELSNSSKRCP